MYIPGHKSTSNQWKGNWSSQPLWWSVNFDRDGSFLKSHELQWNVWFAAGIFGHSHSPSFSKICFSSPCFFASSPRFAESRTDLVHDLSLCDFPCFDVATKPTMVNGCIRSYDMIYINIYIVYSYISYILYDSILLLYTYVYIDIPKCWITVIHHRSCIHGQAAFNKICFANTKPYIGLPWSSFKQGVKLYNPLATVRAWFPDVAGTKMHETIWSVWTPYRDLPCGRCQAMLLHVLENWNPTCKTTGTI